MIFNSLHFALFFPTVVLLHFLVPMRYRWVLLLAASYYFYMAWKPIYAVLLVASTLIDYSMSLLMGGDVRARDEAALSRSECCRESWDSFLL